MELILVGVVHRDALGYGALLKLLEGLRPGVICLELSPLGLVWREGRGPALLRRLDRLTAALPSAKRGHHELRLIRDALALPFEYRASRDYARRMGVPIHLIDLNWVSRENLPLYESDIVTAPNIRTLVQGPAKPLGKTMKIAYERARRCLIQGLWPGDREREAWGDEVARRRERFLACHVRNAADRHARVAYVGGWVHLVGGREGCSLANLLRDLSPRRILLGGEELPPLR